MDENEIWPGGPNWIGDAELAELEREVVTDLWRQGKFAAARYFQEQCDFLGSITIEELRWLYGVPGVEPPGLWDA